jgi:hypothetical protein
MSVWHGAFPAPSLNGADGELVCVRISVDPRELEEILECLAGVSFPVNPQIYHGVPTIVEFPAWGGRLDELRESLRNFGFDPSAVAVQDMLGTLCI